MTKSTPPHVGPGLTRARAALAEHAAQMLAEGVVSISFMGYTMHQVEPGTVIEMPPGAEFMFGIVTDGVAIFDHQNRQMYVSPKTFWAFVRAATGQGEAK